MDFNPYQPPAAALGADPHPPAGPASASVIASFAHVRPWMLTVAAATSGSAFVLLGAAAFMWRGHRIGLPSFLALAILSAGIGGIAYFARIHATRIAELGEKQSAEALDHALASLSELWRWMGCVVLTVLGLGFGLRTALRYLSSQ